MNRTKEIYQEIYSRIRRDVYCFQLPTDADLAEEFNVNIKTIAKAVGALAREGVVERKRRSGARVMTPVHEPRRPALNFMTIRDNAFFEANPWRRGVREFLESLWAEASKKNIPLNLLPHMAHKLKLSEYRAPGHSGNYVVTFGEGDMPPVIRALLKAEFKPILIGRDREALPELSALPFMAMDHCMEMAWRDLIAHLKVRGRSRIGMVHFKGRHDRLPIFRTAVEGLDLPFDARRVAIADNFENRHLALRELLERGADMDALILHDNAAAQYAIDELRGRGQRIPEDVAVACLVGDFDGPFPHQITYTAHDYQSIARETVAIVAEDRYKPGTHYFNMRLVPGQTT